MSVYRCSGPYLRVLTLCRGLAGHAKTVTAWRHGAAVTVVQRRIEYVMVLCSQPSSHEKWTVFPTPSNSQRMKLGR